MMTDFTPAQRELQLIAALLASAPDSTLAQLRPILRNGDAFSEHILGDVWRIIDSTNGAVNIASFTSKMNKKQIKALVEIGGEPALLEYCTQFVSEKNLLFYAQQITANAMQREEQRAAKHLLEGITNGDDPDQVSAQYIDTRLTIKGLFGARNPYMSAGRWGQELANADLKKPVSVMGDGLMVRGSYAILAGEKGSGKSFVALELANCVAAGTPFFGFDTAQGNAYVVSLELPAFEGRRRLFSINNNAMPDGLGLLGLDDFAPTAETPCPPPWPHLADESVQNWIIEYIKSRDIALYIIDPLGATVSGGSENDQMIEIAGALRRIAIESNAAVMGVHHPRKSMGGKTENGAHSLRGASQLGDWASLILILQKSKGIHKLGTPPNSGPRYCAEFEPVWLNRSKINGTFSLSDPPRDAKNEVEEKRSLLQDTLDEKGQITAEGASQLIGRTKKTAIEHLKAIGATPRGKGPSAVWTLPIVKESDALFDSND